MRMVLKFEVEVDSIQDAKSLENTLIAHVENILEGDFREGAWGGYEGPFVRSARGSRES